MSDLLAAAAAALGTPEQLVQRSAEARANATGATVDEVLAAWAGGGDIPVETSAAPDQTPESAPESAPEPETPVSPTPSVAEAPGPIPDVVPPAGPVVAAKPPILVGRTERTLGIVTGAGALFLVAVLLAWLVPALQNEVDGPRSSAIPFTTTAEEGRHVYLREGCWTCHTQQVRPVIPDANLGAVTLADTNQVTGLQRIGPDLSDVGSRVSGVDAIGDFLGAADGTTHPRYAFLSDQDIDRLSAYLAESKTSAGEATR